MADTSINAVIPDRIVQDLEFKISQHERQIERLREQIENIRRSNESQNSLHDLKSRQASDLENRIPIQVSKNEALNENSSFKLAYPLRSEEYSRYGRQLIMPEIGLKGQLRLRQASALIVGLGGLGCPAAAYLAGAGVGRLGLVDGDTVEESNLHRQILHSTRKVGMSKVGSAIEYLKELNPLSQYTPHLDRLTPENAFDIFSDYDIVLDCTDTPASRYLISDTCVLLGKSLVSASALRTEGQLMLFNNPPRPPGDTTGGPCYRCVFPKPPPADSVVSCGEGGILGPVVGVMGVLQALEALKLIASGVLEKAGTTVSQEQTVEPVTHSLTLFSAYSNPQFRTMRLRSRKPNCATCSAQATVTREYIESGSLDYVQFCGVLNPVEILMDEERGSAEGLAKSNSMNGAIIIDVREKVQFELCSIAGSVNIPFSDFTVLARSKLEDPAPKAVALMETVRAHVDASQDKDIYVVCRHGNDSQVVVRQLKESGMAGGNSKRLVDLKGGLEAWRNEVDPTFPVY